MKHPLFEIFWVSNLHFWPNPRLTDICNFWFRQSSHFLFTTFGDFHKWRCPQVIIHFRLGFSLVTHPAIRYPHFTKPPCTKPSQISRGTAPRQPSPVSSAKQNLSRHWAGRRSQGRRGENYTYRVVFMNGVPQNGWLMEIPKWMDVHGVYKPTYNYIHGCFQEWGGTQKYMVYSGKPH